MEAPTLKQKLEANRVIKMRFWRSNDRNVRFSETDSGAVSAYEHEKTQSFLNKLNGELGDTRLPNLVQIASGTPRSKKMALSVHPKKEDVDFSSSGKPDLDDSWHDMF